MSGSPPTGDWTAVGRRVLRWLALLVLVHQVAALTDAAMAWGLGTPASRMQAAAVWSDRWPWMTAGLGLLAASGLAGRWVGGLALLMGGVGVAVTGVVLVNARALVETVPMADPAAFRLRTTAALVVIGVGAVTHLVAGGWAARSLGRDGGADATV